MDLFRLGLRNITGITLPGAVLVLVIVYAFWVVSQTFNPTPANGVVSHTLNPSPATGSAAQTPSGPPAEKPWIVDPWLLLPAWFLISYLLGNVMRLYSADRVDQSSGEFNYRYALWEQKKGNKGRRYATLLYKVWLFLIAKTRGFCTDQCQSDQDALGDEQRLGGTREYCELDGWKESFPYTDWELEKLGSCYPKEMLRFFDSYSRCVLSGVGVERKGFFNYCKMVICHAASQGEQALLEEVQSAEANTRFFAGAYSALSISLYIVAGLGLVEILAPMGLPKHAHFLPGLLAATTAIALGMCAMQLVILERFRRLRYKEVDTVYEAFYLVHRHADSCPVCSKHRPPSVTEEYVAREQLLKEAFANSAQGGDEPIAVSLNTLVSLMRTRRTTKGPLSSLYFAGAEGDHPYFLRNDKVAIGISVLPEDSWKTRLSKRHPNQREIVIVLEGEIELHTDEDHSKTMGKGEIQIIETDQCHSILPVPGRKAVFLFIKTNPDQEPRSKDCCP